MSAMCRNLQESQKNTSIITVQSSAGKYPVREIAKVIGLGVALWIAAALIIGIVGAISDVLLGNVAVGISIAASAVLVFLLPLLAIALLLYDMIKIMRDKDPVFWNKRWYQILLVMGVISTVVSGFALYHTANLGGFGYIGQAIAAAADNSRPRAIGDLRDAFHFIGLFLVCVTFFVTGYITFFKEETESNKHRIQLASDIFKTIFGFVTGVLTTALGK